MEGSEEHGGVRAGFLPQLGLQGAVAHQQQDGLGMIQSPERLEQIQRPFLGFKLPGKQDNGFVRRNPEFLFPLDGGRLRLGTRTSKTGIVHGMRGEEQLGVGHAVQLVIIAIGRPDKREAGEPLEDAGEHLPFDPGLQSRLFHQTMRVTAKNQRFAPACRSAKQ